MTTGKYNFRRSNRHCLIATAGDCNFNLNRPKTDTVAPFDCYFLLWSIMSFNAMFGSEKHKM